MADALPCPLVVDEAYVDFADTNCLSLVRENEKIMVTRTLSKSYALAGLRFGYRRRPAAGDRAAAQGEGFVQLRRALDRRRHGRDRRSGLAHGNARGDPRDARANDRRLARARFRQRADSQANFVWSPHPSVPVEPLYQQLKAAGVLVRYMNYAGWGDGLRISVGTDEQVDACLAL